ncbi:MAG: hypothetical protein K2K90_03255 [Lachnospiraceae bacterium]|nr:hypothetical protein [Lachnospiraceae bacterium]
MDKPDYFQNALSSFVTEAACGGAVRHLTDSGYTLDQIVDRLDYPAPRAKVQRIMMEYLYESRVLLRSEPSEELFAPREQFVQEQDAYGRRSFRKTEIDYIGRNNMTNTPDLTTLSPWGKTAQTREFLWKESVYDSRRDGKLTELLHRKCEKYGETYSYVSCHFGETINDQYSQNGQNGAGTVAEEGISCLNGRQREYIQGIRWEQPVLYHRLNRRMLEIISKLYEAGAYGGACFFVTGREKIVIPAR